MLDRKWAITAITLVMLAALLLITYPLLSSRNLLFQGDITTSDVTELNFPSHYLISTSLKSGGLPLWDPDIGCGFPLHAEGQAGLLYPLNMFLFRLLNPVLAFNLSVVLSLLLALIFSYLLFRQYGISRLSSLYSAIAFTFSGFIVAKLKFTYMVNSAAWLPLALYGLERSFSKRNLKYLLLTAIALALQLLAGAPQIFFITVTLLIVIFLWRFLSLLFQPGIKSHPARKRALIWLLIGFVLAIAIGLALAGPQLMPQAYGYSYFNRSTAGTFQSILATPMQPRSLVMFFSPFQYGNPAYGTYDLSHQFFWEDIAYPGLLTLVLAVIAILFLFKKDRDTWLWLLVGVIALMISLGNSTPLAEFLYKYIPGFNMFRFFQRYLVVVVLSLTVLSGKGLDYLISFFRTDRAWYFFIIVLVFMVLITDLGLFAHHQISTIDSRQLLEPNETVQFLEDNLGEPPRYRYSTLGEDEAWKEAYGLSRGWMGDKGPYFGYYRLLPPNNNDNFDIPGVSQYGAYGLTPTKELWGLTYYGHAREKGWETDIPGSVIGALAMQGARYIVTPYILNKEGLSLVREVETGIRSMDFRIYEIESALPRVTITQQYEIVEDPGTLTISQLSDLLWPPHRVRDRVILEKEPYQDYDVSAGSAGEAEITYSSDRRVVIEADSPGGGILVLSDAYYPEWHVYVDGEERDILRANIAFRAVELEPGHHTVEYFYRPISLYYGAAIGFAGLLLLLLVLLQHRRTKWLDLSLPPASGIGERKEKPGEEVPSPSGDRG